MLGVFGWVVGKIAEEVRRAAASSDDGKGKKKKKKIEEFDPTDYPFPGDIVCCCFVIVSPLTN